MSKNKTAWVFQHVDREGLGTLRPYLEENNFDIVRFHTYREDISRLDAAEPDILIILGGPQGAYESEKYPYLEQEIKIAKQRLDLNKPMLGICLGGQIIAKALGSEVYLGETREVGWHDLSLTTDGYNSPLRHFSPELTSMTHWHGDTFDLPEGATLLATSKNYTNQAFSYGDKILGLQFHPEVIMEKLILWTEEHWSVEAFEAQNMTVSDFFIETNKKLSPLQRQTRLFMDEWLHKAGVYA